MRSGSASRDADQPLVLLRAIAGRRNHAIVVASDHTDDAIKQVAQLVGQIGVVGADEALQREVAILERRDLAQQVVAQRVGSVGLRQFDGVYDVAERFAHLAARRA